MADAAKPKPATIELLDESSGVAKWIGRKVHELVGKYHPHLLPARIVAAWKLNWSEDKEGNTPLGKAVLVSELFWRLLAAHDEEESRGPDFVILLNQVLWNALEEPQQIYILDEMLSYCGVRSSKDGDQAEDDTGRTLWSLLKPEFVGFAGPIARHGAQLKRIKAFLVKAAKGQQLALFKDDAASESEAGGEETASVAPKRKRVRSPKKEDPAAAAERVNEVAKRQEEETERAAAARRKRAAAKPAPTAYYARVDDLFGDGTDWALKFKGPDHRPDDIFGAFALTPPEKWVGVVDCTVLDYQDNHVLLRRCRKALSMIFDERAAAVKAASELSSGEPADTGEPVAHSNNS